MRSTKNYTFLFFILLLAISQNLSAQDNDENLVNNKKSSPVFFSLQFESMHLWRGLAVNNVPVIEPSVGLQTSDKSLKVGVWYNNAISGTYKEFDYFVTYNKKGFTAAVWDIYNFDDSAKYNHTQVFNYNADETGHFIDFDLGYTLQGKYPLAIYTSTVIFGRDRGWDNKKNLYSNYTQLTIPAVMNKDINLSLIIGGAFAFSPDHNKNVEGNEVKGTFYTVKRNADFTNIGFVATHNVNILHHTFPLSGTVSWNPNLNQAHVDFSTVFF
ncbi:MAG: hypothetical protein PW786_09740 [Arachidicoccus sp.]|nr:hypothetical protein [Arachidicoccus sp.]